MDLWRLGFAWVLIFANRGVACGLWTAVRVVVTMAVRSPFRTASEGSFFRNDESRISEALHALKHLYVERGSIHGGPFGCRGPGKMVKHAGASWQKQSFIN